MSSRTLQERLGADLGDRYEIERELGRGGMAVVYVARDRKHDRRVALKLLDPAVGILVGGERFHREIALLARLHHPHILPLHDSGEAAGSLYYVMPYADGESLRDRLSREGRLPVTDALRIAAEVADALAYAHSHRVVHRDVKPENILLPGYPPRPGHTTGGWHAVVCDFGIARLTGRDTRTGMGGTAERHTAHGLALGTPAYMSPEQSAGEPHVDGRADIYALGVVLYEMLAGAMPFANVTPREALAQRLSVAPSLLPVRREVGRVVDEVITRAMEPDPAKRYATASEMAAALQACLADIRSGAARRAADARRRRQMVGAAAAVALAAAAFRWIPREPSRSAVDPGLIAVVPLAQADGAQGAGVGGVGCHQLHDALARWQGARLVSWARVRPARTLDDALDAARALGAGTVVSCELSRRPGDTLVVDATRYDVATGENRWSESVRLAPGQAGAAGGFAELAKTLLLGRVTSVSAGEVGTTVLAAGQAYYRGREHLGRWELDSAITAFREAAAADTQYAQAHLWLAQTLGWSGDRSDTARVAAERAAALGDRLAPRDAQLAGALAALERHQYPAACDVYRRLLRSEPADFAALYGLGECQARDSAVVRSAMSPSGWAFRGSMKGAIDAYTRALQAAPDIYRAFRGAAFARLELLLWTDVGHVRSGLTPDSVRFGAHVELIADTLAFVARPLAEVLQSPLPTTNSDAVFRNRGKLLEVAKQWGTNSPRSPDAQEALARAYEMTGQVTAASGTPSAQSAVSAARSLATAPDQQLRLARTAVRILVKAGDFAKARTLADSLLRSTAPDTPTRAADLASLAALTGQADRLIPLMRRAAPAHLFLDPEHAPVRAPAPVTESALALRGFAALGVCADSINALLRNVDGAILDWAPPSQRAALRHATLATPLELAFPTIGLGPVAEADLADGYLRALQRDFALGNLVAVRQGFARLAATRGAVRPGDVALDGTYQEAWLLAALGDTAAATRMLDRTLNSLPTLDAAMLDEVAQAAALGRALRLRADLAVRAGSRATAARWDAAARALWPRVNGYCGPPS